MTLEQLSHVLEVAKTRSINKAASNLFVSQSTVSLSLQSLEKELGATLFSRTNRGVELTPFGRSFVRYASPLEMQFRQLKNMAQHGGRKDTISFTLANDGFRVPSEICAGLFSKYQSVGIRIEQFDSYGDEARSLVADGVAEIGVIRLWSCYKAIELRRFQAMGLAYHPIHETGVAIMVGPGNPLYHKNVESVTADMLNGYPMIKYGFLDSGPFADIIGRLGLQPSKSTLITSSRAVIYEMLRSTDAYYLAYYYNSQWPDFYSEDVHKAERRSIPLSGTGIRSELGWIARRKVALSDMAQEFTQLLEQRYLLYGTSFPLSRLEREG